MMKRFIPFLNVAKRSNLLKKVARKTVLFGTFSGGLLWASTNESALKKVKACGIVGVVGKKRSQESTNGSATSILLDGLTILQNRGYDSAGLATLNEETQQIICTKKASVDTSDSIQQLKLLVPQKHSLNDVVGIAHTRWATHGGKTDENSHPHLDETNSIALVHNGTIENFHELRQELEAMGVKMRSHTDTEVIVQLIGKIIQNDPELSLAQAVGLASSRLRGTWGLAVISHKEPDRIVVARHGSPLVIGLGEDRCYVASEPIAFARYTKKFIALQDNQVAVVKADGSGLDLTQLNESEISEPVELEPKGIYPGTNDPLDTWLLKEIAEQPSSIARALAFGGRFTSDAKGIKLGGLQSQMDSLKNIKHLLITGCGTSLYAGMYGVRLMRWLGSFQSVNAVDSAEVLKETLPLAIDNDCQQDTEKEKNQESGGVLCLSQSGETKDVSRAISLAQSSNLPTLSIVNTVGSLIARTTGCGVYLNAGRENSVASTKSFTSQVAVLGLVAGWFAQLKQTKEKNDNNQRISDLVGSLSRLPTYSGIALKTYEQCRSISKRIMDAKHIFVLGKGFAEPVALEGALKIKEVACIHAEGFSGGALKHGPFALLEKETPVILFILKDQHAELMRIAAQETKARGARNIIITDSLPLTKNVCEEEDVIVIPSNGPMTALLGVIPLQLMAYHLAKQNPNIKNLDTPRNLAKAVTVD